MTEREDSFMTVLESATREISSKVLMRNVEGKAAQEMDPLPLN